MSTKDNLIITSSVLIITAFLITGLIFVLRGNRDYGVTTCNDAQCTNEYRVTGTRYCDDPQPELQPFSQVCQDVLGCTNTQAPCVWNESLQETICPGEENYTSLCEDINNCRCYADKICSPDTAVYFVYSRINGVDTFLQKQIYLTGTEGYSTEPPLRPGSSRQSGRYCSLSVEQRESMMPYDCIRGTLTLNSRGRFYCSL